MKAELIYLQKQFVTRKEAVNVFSCISKFFQPSPMTTLTVCSFWGNLPA
jgi:hypothetical protein